MFHCADVNRISLISSTEAISSCMTKVGLLSKMYDPHKAHERFLFTSANFVSMINTKATSIARSNLQIPFPWRNEPSHIPFIPFFSLRPLPFLCLSLSLFLFDSDHRLSIYLICRLITLRFQIPNFSHRPSSTCYPTLSMK